MSVTLTVKLAVPAAVGVPDSTTVPAAASVVRLRRRQPGGAGAEAGDAEGRVGRRRPTP